MVDTALLDKHISQLGELPRIQPPGYMPANVTRAWYQSAWMVTYTPVASATLIRMEPEDATVIGPGGQVRSTNGVLVCGTACCLAGYIALDTAPEGTILHGDYLTLPDGADVLYSDWARDQLQITPDDASQLFHPTNSLADLRYIAARITARDEATRG
jgi:hypothetical protein